MCVMCVGLWVDMDSHPDVRLYVGLCVYVLDGGRPVKSHSLGV